MKVTKTVAHELTPEEIESILCQHLKLDPKEITFKYVLHDVSDNDSRFPQMEVKHLTMTHTFVREVPDGTSMARIIAKFGE
jgi:hypothetical protein